MKSLIQGGKTLLKFFESVFENIIRQGKKELKKSKIRVKKTPLMVFRS